MQGWSWMLWLQGYRNQYRLNHSTISTHTTANRLANHGSQPVGQDPSSPASLLAPSSKHQSHIWTLECQPLGIKTSPALLPCWPLSQSPFTYLDAEVCRILASHTERLLLSAVPLMQLISNESVGLSKQAVFVKLGPVGLTRDRDMWQGIKRTRV